MGTAIMAIVLAVVLLVWLRTWQCWRQALSHAEAFGLEWCRANAGLVEQLEEMVRELRHARCECSVLQIEQVALLKRLELLERGVGGPREGGRPADIARIKADPPEVGQDAELACTARVLPPLESMTVER